MTNQKQLIMDIAINLNRIGNWVTDDFEKNIKKIGVFIVNTDEYISKVENFNSRFAITWNNFIKVYPKMVKTPQDNAENLMTWGNILTHRSKLIEA